MSADMRLFHSPVFHAPVETMSTSMDRPTMPRLLLQCNAKKKYLLFEAVLDGFDSDSTSEAEFV
jgi:hypothetical protein